MGKDPMLENVRLRCKLAYFGHIVQGDGLEKVVVSDVGCGWRKQIKG